MSRLHGIWLDKKDALWIWGEKWQALSEDIDNLDLHPFALEPEELINLLQDNWQLTAVSRLDNLVLSLPSQSLGKPKRLLPLLEEQADLNQENLDFRLKNWLVPGILLPLSQVSKFLGQVSLGIMEDKSQWGEDLKFWSYIYHWSIDLIERQKFLPIVISSCAQSCWCPLLDSINDQTILSQLIHSMPRACFSYTGLVISNEELILSFLRSILDQVLRTCLKSVSYPPKKSWLQPWFKSLNQKDLEIKLEPKDLRRLENAFHRWTLPVHQYLLTPDNLEFACDKFHVCFSLIPPNISHNSEDEEQGNWLLKYGLQALDDHNLLIDAETIWSHHAPSLSIKQRFIKYPQELLLKGLGIAAKVFEPVKSSLQESLPTHCLLNPIQVYELIRETSWQLLDNGLGIILPPGLSPDVDEKRLGIKVQAEIEQSLSGCFNLRSLLKYDLQLSVGEQTLSQNDFQKLLSQRSPLVEVNGQWIILQPADVRAAQSILNQKYERTTLSVEDALRVSLGEPAQIAKLPIIGFSASGDLKNLLNHLMGNQPLEPIHAPQNFQGQLRPYQANGVGWLSFLEQWGLGACLADDMGLGKTPQLLGFLLHLHSKRTLQKPVLLICPTSILTNWEREVKKFAPSLTTLIHHGDKRISGSDFVNSVSNYNIVITSYSLVQRDLNFLNSILWQGIVLDEAQNIKNPQSKQSLAIGNLNGDFRIALTGTPIENRLSELWSIFEFLNPGFLGNQAFFVRRFAIPIEKNGDKEALKILRSLVRPFILRRLKTDKSIIQDLPEKLEMNIFCSLSSMQADLYQNLVDSSLSKIEESQGIKRHGLILTLLLKLKQLCNHPALLLKEHTIKSPELSGKLLRLEEMLEELIVDGDRALIFTQFSEWGKLLVPYLEQRLNRQVFFLHGATPRQERTEMIDRFQEDPNGPPIFILSLKAGGTGLNLTRANHVFHVDRWWNPAVENQATDRAFRIGQRHNVQVYKFISTGTLEERINDILESKIALAEQTVDAGETWLSDLDTGSLRNLLLLDRGLVIEQEKRI